MIHWLNQYFPCINNVIASKYQPWISWSFLIYFYGNGLCINVFLTGVNVLYLNCKYDWGILFLYLTKMLMIVIVKMIITMMITIMMIIIIK